MSRRAQIAMSAEETAAHRYELTAPALDAVRRHARKRVALRFVARETATWDHRKL